MNACSGQAKTGFKRVGWSCRHVSCTKSGHSADEIFTIVFDRLYGFNHSRHFVNYIERWVFGVRGFLGCLIIRYSIRLPKAKNVQHDTQSRVSREWLPSLSDIKRHHLHRSLAHLNNNTTSPTQGEFTTIMSPTTTSSDLKTLSVCHS